MLFRSSEVIDYTDRTVQVNATSKSADDKITAWIGSTDGTEVYGETYSLTSGEDSPEIMLPTEFLASDDATTTVYVKVESRDGNSGIYEIVLTRSERKKGNARLESMSIEAAGKAVAGYAFDSETSDYEITLGVQIAEVAMKAVAKSPH